MNPYGFSPRTWAYLVSLDLSEVIGHHVLPKVTTGQRAEAERFAAAEWRLVGRLDRFQDARTKRNLPSLRADLAALRTAAAALPVPRDVKGFVSEKLDEIAAALDDVETEVMVEAVARK